MYIINITIIYFISEIRSYIVTASIMIYNYYC